MAADTTPGRWNGNGRNGGGVGVMDVALSRKQSRRTDVSGGEPPSLPLTGVSPRAPGWLWLKALIGGIGLCAFLFLVLGYIQPVFKKNERIEIPNAVKLILRGGAQEKKKGKTALKRKDPTPKKPRQEKSRPRESKVLRPTAVKQVAQPRARQDMSILKNVSMFTSIGGAGAGAGSIEIAFSTAEEQAVQKWEEIRDWKKKRDRVRQGRGYQRDDGPLSGGRGGPQSMGIQMGAGEAEYLPPPKYPRKALNDQQEGWVQVRLLISITGSVEKYEIVAAQPPGYFEDAIEEVLPSWRFTPAVDPDSGRPIEFWEEYTYQFKLEDAAL